MNNSIDPIKNHLQFFGYKVETDQLGERELIIARHSKHNNLIVVGLDDHIVYFRMGLSTEKTEVTNEMYKALAEINGSFEIQRAVLDLKEEKVNLNLESFYSGDYSKESFARFLEVINRDADEILPSVEAIKEFTD